MAVEVKIPSVGESVAEVTLASWLVEDGAYVEMDEPICELETDKASQELFAEAAGNITHKVSEGDNLEIGALIAEIDDSVAEPASEAVTENKVSPEPDAKQESKVAVSNSDNYATGHPSPAAAKVLAEKGIDVANVKGTGVDGRITKEDALAAKKETKESKKVNTVDVSANLSETRQESRLKMSRMRQTIAKRLVAVKNETAMLTTFNEVDMTEIMSIRKKYKEIFKEKHNIGLGFMSFFTKAVCLAAKEFPAVNGKIVGDEIITYNYCDIGIAVSTSKGLVVPVIRDADKMTLAQIEKAIMAYALKARENKIALEDMQGGTFTITNGGVFGSMLSTPIINGDQSAILGMHNIVQRPMAVNGNVEIRPIMYLAVSYDHRIVDGKESVSFLYKVKELLEDPARLLLEI